MFEHTLTGHTLEIVTILIGTFLMGLWLGWLLWSKYKRYVDEMRQENESLQGALQVTQSDLANTKDKLIGAESEAATLHQTLETVQWEASEIKKKMNVIEVDLAEQLKVNYTLNKQLSSAMALSPEAAKVETEVEVSPIDISLESLVENEENEEILDSQDVDEEKVIQEAELEETVEIASEPIEISIEEPIVEIEVKEDELTTDVVIENETQEDKVEVVTETEAPEVEVAADIIAEMESADIVDASTASEGLQVTKTVESPTPALNSDIPYTRSNSRSVIVKTVRVRREEKPKKMVERVVVEPKPIEKEIVEEPAAEVVPVSVETILEESALENEAESQTGAWSEIVEIAGTESEETSIENSRESKTVEVPEVVPTMVPEKEELVQTEEEIVSVTDDLKKIEGIGPKTAALLTDNGIHTFAALAQTPVSTLKELLAEAGYRMFDPQTWPAQALLASNGEWDNLKDYQKYLVGGKRPD